MGRILMSGTGNTTTLSPFSNFTVEAATTASSDNRTSEDQYSASVRRGASFNPFLAIAVSGMVISFFAVGFASGYLRRWIWGYDDETRHRELQLRRRGHLQNQTTPSKAGQRGLDPEVVAAIPLVHYKDLPPAPDEKYLDCPVCLATFDATDDLKLLPQCAHAFHSDCIDEWFRSHSTCPLCRLSLAPTTKSYTQGDRDHLVAAQGQDFDVDATSRLESQDQLVRPSSVSAAPTVDALAGEVTVPRSILCRSDDPSFSFVPAIRVDVANAKLAVVSSIRRSNSVGTFRRHVGYVVDSEGTQHGNFQISIDGANMFPDLRLVYETELNLRI